MHQSTLHIKGGMTTIPILLVEDDPALRDVLEATLSEYGYECLSVSNSADAIRLLERKQFAMMLSDVQLPDGTGLNLQLTARKLWPAMSTVLMTAHGTTEDAVQAIRDGAKDYIEKPFSTDNLLEIVERHARRPAKRAGVIAKSALMQRILQVAEKVAASPATVLLTGESGSGKEVLARFIHDKSTRSAGPFIAINCASIPNDLLESILFGHAKGSFTGAHQAHSGKIQQANAGTLFLDEIGEMSTALQAKLLRVMQEREIEPIGANMPIKIDVRFIAATHRNLPEEIQKGTFRADLFYRLNVFPIGLPALRDRIDDILPLAEALVERYAPAFGKDIAPLSAPAQHALLEYSWPGNVRELENAIQRALILCERSIGKEDLGLPSAKTVSQSIIKPLREIERVAIAEAVSVFDGDLRLAADALEIPYRSLVAKIKALNLPTKEKQ
jgi:two-component system response regulator FlrC